MNREDALQLLALVRQQGDHPPEFNKTAFVEWYVAVRDQSGVGLCMKQLDQEIGRLARRLT